MRPTGMGWLKDIGLTEEELAKAQSNFVPIETVENKPGMEPIVINVGKYDGGNADVAKYGGYAPSKASIAARGASQSAMAGYKKPDLESEEIAAQDRDNRDARANSVTGTQAGMEEPAERQLASSAAAAKALGLQEDEISRAAHSDNMQGLIAAVSRLGVGGSAAISGQPYRDTMPREVFNEADKVRGRIAAAKDFDLREKGAEAKAANMEHRAYMAEQGLLQGDRKIAAANDRADKANAAMLQKAEELGYTQKEIADMKAQLAAKIAAENNKTKVTVQGMKPGRKGGAGLVNTNDAEVGFGNSVFLPKPGYSVRTYKDPNYKKFVEHVGEVADVNNHIDEVERLTQKSRVNPVASITDGTNAALLAAANKAKTAITTATGQGVMNLADEPRADKMLGQTANLLQDLKDRFESSGDIDAAKLAAFNAALRETKALFTKGLQSKADAINYEMTPRKKKTDAPTSGDGVTPNAAKPAPVGKVAVIKGGKRLFLSPELAKKLIDKKEAEAAP